MESKSKKKNEVENQNKFDFSKIFHEKQILEGEADSKLTPSFVLLSKIQLFNDNLLKDLQEVLKIEIKNQDYYKLALLHRSIIPYLQKRFGHEGDYELLNNERLEFLGDSVFNFIISEKLFLSIASKDEGVLSNIRAKLINRPILGEVARKLRLDDFIQTSFNARGLIDAGNLSILSNGLEAIIGAVFLDHGFEKTKQFVLDIIFPLLAECHEHDSENYKSILMELVQSYGKPYPKYEVMGETGPDHQKTFMVGVFVENKLLGTGLGSTKKEAEQFAAKKVLELSLNLS